MLAAERVVVPEPVWLTEPVPLMRLETVKLLVRSKLSAALSVTFPVPRLPVVPALPIWSVPALIVVMPL